MMTSSRIAVSGVRNPTHALYVSSWLRRRSAEGGRMSVIFDVDGGLVNALSCPEVAESFPCQVDRLVESEDVAGVGVYVAVGTPGVKPYLKLRGRGLRSGLSIVVVDEGVGTYGSWPTRFAGLRREGSSPIRSLVRATSVGLARSVLTDIRWALHERTTAGWVLNDVIVDEFRRHHSPPRVGSAANPDGEVVYLAQPWVRLGVIGVTEYRDHLNRIAGAVDKIGSHFVVRPHPTETAEAYRGFATLDGGAPAEIDQRLVNARLLLGESSSALLNIAAIFGTPAARVDGPTSRIPGFRLSADQRSLFDTYVPASITIEQIGATLR